MKNIIRVTEKELAQILLAVETKIGMPMLASTLQGTRPKMLVKSRINKDIKNTFTDVVKVSKASIILNTDYERGVIKQLEREGKESSEYIKGVNTMPIEFGANNEFIGTYNGEFVLQYRPNDNIKPKTKFIASGKITDKAKLIDFLPTEKKAENQGTEREILWRKVYLKNISKLAILGKIYKLIK